MDRKGMLPFKTKSIMAYKNDLTPFGTLHIIADCFGSWSLHTLKVKCAGLGAIPQWEWQVRPSSTILPLRQQQGGIRSVGSGLGDHRQIHLENHKLCKVTNCNIITLEEQLGTAVVVVIFILNNIYGVCKHVVSLYKFVGSRCAKTLAIPLLMRLRRAGFSRAAATRSLSASLDTNLSSPNKGRKFSQEVIGDATGRGETEKAVVSTCEFEAHLPLIWI